ncbi:hypothetical protein Nepgr_015577 [Nepenthes gracilis]|uniref:BHLH domain-containing protein n=1 Tax=Nepenthes gracilis TaxID=150966 RepID=A0AAD3SNV3_NEPGR|nr:hypothetical protein Nepgr_015577 [Nepenthes gracilis]
MDSVFQLGDSDRASFLNLMLSFGCTYTCLWSYSSTLNCLYFKDGYFRQDTEQASSSSGSLAYRLFNEYRQQSIFVNFENDLIPGLAFKLASPYVEMGEVDLLRLASSEPQRQFYSEAQIKTAVFMGCGSGEIELGISNLPHINLEMEMKNLFPEDFKRQDFAQSLPPREIPRPITFEQNLPSSSPSLSTGSSEYSSLLFNIPSSLYLQEQLKEAIIMEQSSTKPMPSGTVSSTTAGSKQLQPQAFQALTQSQNLPFPTAESTDAAITRAILAILCSPTSSSSSQQTQQSLPYKSRLAGRKASAFKSYKAAASALTGQIRSSNRRGHSIMKRGILFFRSLMSYQRQQEQGQGSRPASLVHHVISERRRRGKINESFQTLRSLLPPGTKKDKASVLKSTTDYLSSLKSQISELEERNRLLESELASMKGNSMCKDQEDNTDGNTSANERFIVRIVPTSESSSEARIVDLQVVIRGNISILTLVIQILEILKKAKGVKLVSMEAQSHAGAENHRLILRLRIEGTDWDEAAFQEAVKRVVADQLAHLG